MEDTSSMDRKLIVSLAILLSFALARADQNIYEPTIFNSGSKSNDQ